MKKQNQNDQIAKDTLEEVKIFVQEAGDLADVEDQFKKEADDVVSEADVLAQAQSAADWPDEEPEDHAPKKDGVLFSEASALVQAAEAMDAGSEKADRSNIRELDDTSDSLSLQSVIDSKIASEEERLEENKLRTEIADEMETE